MRQNRFKNVLKMSNFHFYHFQENFHLNYHFDENLVPVFLLPEGTYKIIASMSMNNVVLAKGNVVFDLVVYSSEKQKNRMG